MRLQLSARVLAALSATLALAPRAARAQEHANQLSLDTLTYADSDHVYVVSPQLTMRHTLDARGGQVSARAGVDVISAASVDVISAATHGFTEVREEATLSLSRRLGEWLPGAHYRTSREPDYVSNGGGVSLELDLGSRDTTASASYELTLDTVGRTGTPFDAWSAELTTHTGEVSLTQVLDPHTLVRGSYTLVRQLGYMEKPYRYVPLFDADGVAAAAADGVTLDVDSFDRYRLPERPPEEVPDARLRQALAVRALHYLDSVDGSLRLDYRFYLDSWGVHAHTGELGLRLPVGESQLELIERLYWQDAADFWARVYVVEDGTMPRWRTLDRDLGAYLADTVTLRLGRVHETWSWYALAALNYTRYDDYLFLGERTALIVQAGWSWTP